MRHTVRIIAGQWKGFRLRVPKARNLRPSPDPVRETLFNWIGHRVIGAKAIDLFAGTGSLGFEALSRGASHVTFLERNTRVATTLRDACEKFDLTAERARVVCINCTKWLRANTEKWDIAFVDPPFHLPDVAGTVLTELVNHLEPDGLVYLECNRRNPSQFVNYSTWKSSISGEVEFKLLKPLSSGETHDSSPE